MTIEERVERGANLLDERAPGWYDRIKIQTLVMSEPCKCVIGQVFLIEPDGLDHDQYKAITSDLGLPGQLDVYYGFEVSDDDDALDYNAEYQLLHDAWIDLIEQRRR